MSNVQRVFVTPRVEGNVGSYRPPLEELGSYDFGDRSPQRFDQIEWNDGRIYVVCYLLWREDGGYDVVVTH